MSPEAIVLLTVFLPLVGSLTIPLAALGGKTLRNGWMTVLAFVTAALPLTLIPFALEGGEEVFRVTLFMGFDFILIIDALSVWMAIVSSSIGFLIAMYSIGYVGHDESQNEYFLMVIMFIGSMMGIVFSANLVFLYLFWEISAICCWRLIGFYRAPNHIIKADKAFLVTFFGAVMMLLGFILIYHQTGTFDLTEMRGTTVSGTVILLILLGMFSKSATVPLHTWLPDAGVAPSPVTALLHAAVLVKIGVYAFARIFCFTFTLPVQWQTIIMVLALVSSFVAAGAAIVDNDLKRILAYSTVSQIGYIFLGFATLNPVGVTGALLFILMHGIAKAGLFLCAGIVEHNTHKRDIRELGGLIKTMPVTAVAFLCCALSVIGIPPFGGFFSKFMVISGAVQNNQIIIAALALLVAVMTMFYLFRLFYAVFLGELKAAVPERTVGMVVTVTLLAVLSLGAGLLIAYPAKLADLAALEMLKR